jgi:hypothetical protein
MDSTFEFHYNQFKQAGSKLANPEGLTVKDFKMWDTTREASATAIALEAGIIDHIPADGRLGKHDWQAVQLLIRRYELGAIAA